ncbi:dd70af0a-0a22-4304-92bc-f4e9476ab905 [Sclerotinia trifoliorum]|uniref:Dd70af0a-0a22-4304-92bc-f4e9476ab905 n=1 Tax=Sclerotinia trifoliorum TaxID=28548 RepID=A0A8H2VNZ6_9HELO|nr:dd70af0a-0a22-4304-92bc-f4e9476ab905 [Sclerotinia trifoliorum]
MSDMAVANSNVPLPTRPMMKSAPNLIPRKHSITPPMSDRGDRTSFSSVKENTSGVPQSFTDSKVSSYLKYEVDSNENEIAIDDTSSGGSRTPPENAEPDMQTLWSTNPHSTLHGFVCPCDGFRGWKQIAVRGKVASKSYSDLRNMKMGWGWDSDCESKVNPEPELKPAAEPVMEEVKVSNSGKSPIEMLPAELLGAIIDQLVMDIPPGGITPRNVDLMSLLLTSHAMHSATLASLYTKITIPHSRVFRKFLAHIRDYPALGTIVRRLDFSHFNPTGIGLTARQRAETLNLIPATLLECLSLTPNLREFLSQEHIDDDMDSKVIQKLLCELTNLQALDFCACSSASFRDSFTTAVNTSPLPKTLPFTRLSFHECTNLPSSVFETLLPRLPYLTHLDVAHTRITDDILFSIPQAARLTHLNISKCSYLSGERVVEFLSTHPAVRSLAYLNLGSDIKSHEMLNRYEVASLLPILPDTLRSLSLKGSEMHESHIPLFLPLTKHLEELGLGHGLVLSDVRRLFVPDQDASIEEQIAWVPHSLHYIDVSDLSKAQLDLGTLFGSSCPILRNDTLPLEVMEISTECFKVMNTSSLVKRAGWCLKEAGRRYWLVREDKTEESQNDSGGRQWKWGANYWGMRKVPVARAEVGGMYGHYMFKR